VSKVQADLLLSRCVHSLSEASLSARFSEFMLLMEYSDDFEADLLNDIGKRFAGEWMPCHNLMFLNVPFSYYCAEYYEDGYDEWMIPPLSARSDYESFPGDTRLFDGQRSAATAAQSSSSSSKSK
jgi:hypothetical protein